MVNLLSITGKISDLVDLELLTFIIPLDKNIYKFKGYGDFNYFNILNKDILEDEYDIDIKKKFFHSCSFFKSQKMSLKIFINGSFHLCGFNTEEESIEYLNYILNNIINKDYYIYIKEKNELIKIYNNNNVFVKNYKINLNTKNIIFSNELTKNKTLCFSKQLKQNLNFDFLNIETYLISDAFKSTAINLKIRDIKTKKKLGFINIFNFSVIFSSKSEHILSELEKFFTDENNIKKMMVPYFNSRKNIMDYLIKNDNIIKNILTHN